MTKVQRSLKRRDRGSVLMIALLVTVILSLLGIALLTLSGTESDIAYNQLWSEGAFTAAEAGVETALGQIGADTTTSMQAVPVTAIGTGTYTYQFRSGHKSDPAPMPLGYSERLVAGFSIAIGTGYNSNGYSYSDYLINATGTGPRNAQRELEVLAEYGPVVR